MQAHMQAENASNKSRHCPRDSHFSTLHVFYVKPSNVSRFINQGHFSVIAQQEANTSASFPEYSIKWFTVNIMLWVFHVNQ